jgi:ketosteroid isomerase-like protein
VASKAINEHIPKRKGANMKRIKWIKVIFAAAACLLIAALAISRTDGQPTPAAGPTTENALAAEQELTRAFRMNDADAIGRLLDDDWAVVSTDGALGDGIHAGFLAEIKSGNFTRKTMEISNPRVRVYGNIALVTTQLATSGTFAGRSFDVRECQTDVLLWRAGAWKSVLLHETKTKE